MVRSKFEINDNYFPSQVLDVLYKLWNQRYAAYVVGGAVRDKFLNKEPHDWDVATNASLEEITRIFPNSKIVGAAFGVALVTVDGMEIQVARFRTERGYSDSRHPDEINFVRSIEDDLSRRDFTINAIAIGLEPGDPTFWIVRPNPATIDVISRTIRTVGNPDDRFQEDALRMMRAVRFAAQLETMKIYEDTLDSIKRNANLIKNISAERIQDEFNKILMTDHPSIALNLMADTGLMWEIIPEMRACYGLMQNHWHAFDVFTHMVKAADATPKDLTMRLASLFHDIGKPVSMTTDENGVRHFYGSEIVPAHQNTGAAIAVNVLERLRYDRKIIDEVGTLVLEHMLITDDDFSTKTVRRMIARFGEERLRKLAELKRADWEASGTHGEGDGDIDKFIEKIGKVMNESPPVSFTDLAVNGNDIIQVTGLKPGIEVGRIKQHLMDLVVDDPSKNDREFLLEYIRKEWNSDDD